MATEINSIDFQTALAELSPYQQRELLSKLLREKAERARKFPMSASQQGLWHAYRRDPHDTHYNVFLPVRVRSALDLNALRNSIDLIVSRHACLRTVFLVEGDQLVQRVCNDLKPEFDVRNLQGASEPDVRQLLERESQRPFDLESGPLVRLLVCELAPDDWVLLAVAHHIVVDFWSLVLILSELRTAYPIFKQGAEPKLPDATNNYAEFVQEQTKLLSSQRGEAFRDYWQDSIEGASTVIEFPTDRIRPRRFSGRAGNTPLVFPPSIVPRLRQFVSNTRSTTAVVLQAALGVLISRYTGASCFLVGCPFSGRSQRKYESTVGFFVNMLPLKADLRDDPDFVQLTRRTMTGLQGALEHEQYPLAQIVADSSLPRDAGRTPLFQVSCTFEKAQVRDEVGRAGFLLPGRQQTFEFAGTHQEAFHLTHPTCRYDLEFIFEQTSSTLRGMICYASDLFDPESVQAISTNFTSLLEALLTYSDRPISQVPWTTDPRQATTGRPSASPGAKPAPVVRGAGDIAERLERPETRAQKASANTRVAAQPLSDMPPTAPEAASQKLHETVEQLILRSGPSSRLAMQSETASYTYEQLHALSAELARGLQKLGIGRGAIVPVVAAKGPAAFLLMLSVHRAGAAVLPIDSSRLQALDYQLADTSAPLIIAENEETKTRLETSPVQVVSQEELLLLGNSNPSGSLDENRPDDLAYVIYTSGSTGHPKAVMIEHGAVCNTLRWRMKEAPCGPQDRLLMLLSHQFDACLGNGWTTLAQGATLIWADVDAEIEPSRLIDQLHRDGITVLPAVPSLLRILIEQPRFPRGNQLRYIWTGGEAVPSTLPERIRSVSSAPFWNFYGPTEASIEAAACNIAEHDASRTVPIGYPASGTEIIVVDELRQIVPDTVPGELAICGPGLARGYLNDPELTAEKFVALQDASGETKRVYLTGDRGRWNANGRLEFLGRTDDQIKLNGYRIELGEIESVLQAHEDVDRAAVKLVSRNETTTTMVAFASLKTKAPPVAEASVLAVTTKLRRYLAEQLPAYKIPSAVMVLDELPTTSGGKIDKARLPDVSPEATRQIIPPSTALEKFLADAWCEVLGMEEISVDQNFFDAGGSSLQAAVVTSRLSQDLGVHVPTALIFDLADISQIANRLVELHPEAMSIRFGAELSSPASSGPASHPLIANFKLCQADQTLFMIHPPGGIVACYRQLALQLGDRQQLHAVRSRGLHGAEELPASLREMAAEYVEAIQSVQPTGPYTIGGWSMGGLIAYEIAGQLHASGEIVRRLILLDTTIPEGATDYVHSKSAHVGQEYGIDLTLEELAELAPEDQLPFLWDHAKKLGVIEDDSPPELVASVLQDLQELFHHHVELSSRHQLKPLDVPITLYRPLDVPVQAASDEPLDRGWSRLSPQVEVQFVSGHHHSMVQPPHVTELAKLISERLGTDTGDE